MQQSEKNHAVGYVRKFTFSGIFAWLIWGFIHIFYLVNYRSQFGVMLQWVFNYASGLRGARLIFNSIEKGFKSTKNKKKKEL